MEEETPLLILYYSSVVDLHSSSSASPFTKFSPFCLDFSSFGRRPSVQLSVRYLSHPFILLHVHCHAFHTGEHSTSEGYCAIKRRFLRVFPQKR